MDENYVRFFVSKYDKNACYMDIIGIYVCMYFMQMYMNFKNKKLVY